jgi:hypothetical protein
MNAMTEAKGKDTTSWIGLHGYRWMDRGSGGVASIGV